jgi:short-subunit dehydrogenase
MKTVLITGISKGLGKELFELFISKHYYVYGLLRNKLEAEKLKNQLPENGKVILADLSSDESMNHIQTAIGQNPVDLLVNNAGIGGRSNLIDKIESNEILELFNVHCLGVFRTVKALKTDLLNANQPVVININSRLGSITRQSNGAYKNIPVSYSYRIGKAAQNMLTNCLRTEFKDKIKFLSIHPGKMKTDIAQVDANVEPKIIANKILQHYENKTFVEENGIVELERGLIEW